MALPAVQLVPKSIQFIQTAMDGGTDRAALDLLRGASMEQAIWSCGSLPSDVRSRLLAECTDGIDDRQSFALSVALNLTIPTGTYHGVTSDISGSQMSDYDIARIYIVAVRDKPAGGIDAPSPGSFYPEYVCSGPRATLSQVALGHGDLDRSMPRQVALCSFGGFLGWTKAAALSNRFSTCGVFVQIALVAAGYKGFSTKELNPQQGAIYTYVGLGEKGESHPAFVKLQKGREPKPGDIFLLGSPPTHTGIVISHLAQPDAWLWETVEGGQKEGYRTIAFLGRQNKTLKLDKGGTPWMGDRPIYGWIDLDKYKPWS
jgi:hypothetical protein